MDEDQDLKDDRVNQLCVEVQSLKRNIVFLQKDNAKLTQEVVSFKREDRSRQQQIESLSEANKNLKQENSTLQGKVSRLSDENKRLKEAGDTSREQVDFLSFKVKTLRQESLEANQKCSCSRGVSQPENSKYILMQCIPDQLKTIKPLKSRYQKSRAVFLIYAC